MNDKSQPNALFGPFAGSDFFQFMNPAPVAEIQRRNMEAITRSASKISGAIAAVASKQMEALSSLGSARPNVPPSGPGDFAGFFAAQLQNGRAAMEKAITEMRAANDTMRHCWYEVASEFEACAHDNMNSMEEQFKKSSSERGPKAVVSPTLQQRAKSAAE